VVLLIRNSSSQRRKVEEARRVVAEALGDQLRRDTPQGAAKFVPMAKAEPVEAKSETICVLSLGEVAARLNISRTELERMIAVGKLRALETGYSLMVPSDEVERSRVSRG
jgi:excisionase family DNA binding protein